MLSWRYCGPWDLSMMLMPSSSASLRKSGALLYLQDPSFTEGEGTRKLEALPNKRGGDVVIRGWFSAEAKRRAEVCPPAPCPALPLP